MSPQLDTQTRPRPKPGDQVHRVAIIRPGVYVPGGGPFAGQRVAITEDFIRAAAPTMEGQPVNLEHSRGVNDEVGYHANVAVERDDRGVVLRADVVLQQGRPRFSDAVSFIENRLEANQVPEYSMEIPHDSLVFQEPEQGETLDGEPFDVKVLAGSFAGGAILSEGACSAEDGCGIGLSRANHGDHFFCPGCNNTCRFVVPDTPTGLGFSTDSWSTPSLEDFRSERGVDASQLTDWSTDDKAWLASHYMWAESSPSDLETFNDLKLPYRRPGDSINLNALRSILATLGGARGGVEGIPDTDRDRIESRARALLEEGNETTESHSHRISTQLAEHRQDIPMPENTETTEEPGDPGGPTASLLENLAEERNQLQKELKEAKSLGEEKETQLAEMKERVAEIDEQEKSELTSQLEDVRGDGFVENEFGDDPSLEELRAAVKAVNAERTGERDELASQLAEAKSEEFVNEHFGNASLKELRAAVAMLSSDPEPEPETPERKTTASRQESARTVTTPHGKVNLDAYNALREQYALPPVDPDTGDLNPVLESVFKRAKGNMKGRAMTFKKPNRKVVK